MYVINVVCVLCSMLPQHIINGHQGELTEAVILQHSALAGLPQGTAEEYYILAAQQLEGYGQETFTAKVVYWIGLS